MSRNLDPDSLLESFKSKYSNPKSTMRQILRFSPALALGLLAVMLLGQLRPDKVTAQEPRASQQPACADYAATDCTAVEVNGVRFEAIVPEQVWQIPENRPGAYTPIQIRFRITNLSPVPYRFAECCILYVALIDSTDRVAERARPIRDVIPGAEKVPLLKQGESAVFVRDGQLFWCNNRLRIEGFFADAQYWGFDGLQPGNYDLSFFYMHLHGEADSQHRDPYGLWTGAAAPPRIKIQLIESQAKSDD